MVAQLRPTIPVPPDFRPRFLDDDDPAFLGLLGVFATLAAVMVIAFANTELPEVRSLDELPAPLARMFLPPPTVEPPPPVEQIANAAQQPVEPTPAPAAPEQAPEPVASASRPSRDALRQDVLQSSIMLSMLTSRGRSRSLIAGLIDAEPNGAIDDALHRATGGVRVASTGGLRASAGVGGTGDVSISELGALGASGGAQATLTAPPATTIAAPPQVMVELASDLELDGDGEIGRVVRRYFGQLTACYEQELREDPGLGGRVEVEWTIARGRVTSADIALNSTGNERFAACVRHKVERWVFPLSVEGDVSYPFVFRSKRQRPR